MSVYVLSPLPGPKTLPKKRLREAGLGPCLWVEEVPERVYVFESVNLCTQVLTTVTTNCVVVTVVTVLSFALLLIVLTEMSVNKNWRVHCTQKILF